MGILSGSMSVSRLRVLEPELGEGWRDSYRDQLNKHAFTEPPQGIGREEVEGWCQTRNLLDTGFDDFNDWLWTDYALFALRIDKKRLPAKLVSAMLEKRCQAWAQEHGLERCPASRRTELKEALEDELLLKTLPSVRTTEVAWHLTGGWVIVHSHSDAMVERVRKRFFRTFNKRLVPWSPLEWIGDDAEVDQLMSLGPSLSGRIADGGDA